MTIRHSKASNSVTRGDGRHRVAGQNRRPIDDYPGVGSPLVEIAARAEALATPVARASDLHGPEHWRSVARLAARLLAEAPRAHPRSLFLFAAVHDTQRLNDAHDPDHGIRAAAVLEREIDHGLDAEQLERLLFALRNHSGGAGPPTSDDPTIGACWDADRLTLDRVEIPPEPLYISTPSVKADLQRFRELARAISEGPDLSWEEIAAAFDSAPPAATREQRLLASDFYGYLRPSRCGLRVWLREQGEQEEPPGAFAETLMRLGIEHERRHLERFGGALDIGELPREEQREATIAAVEEGERVIYQGRMHATAKLAGREIEVVGLPDFMLPARSGYAIRDSKLNRRVGPNQKHVRLQLEAYGWLYEQTFGEPPISLQVHSGSGEIITLDYGGGDDALEAFEQILRYRLMADEPADEHVGVSKCGGCGFRSRCWPLAERRRDVGLLPFADRGLIDALHDEGTSTLPQLVERYDAERLAALERPTWGGQLRPVGERAGRLLTNARALLEQRPILISPPEIPEHPTYVMFDLEGMPPTIDEIEKIYIWGLQAFGARPGPFRAGVAGFGPRGDREGWESFLAEAGAIFDELGDVPFVHWAAYEKVKLNLYLERYGDRDGVAERVLANLLDLLPITREAVAVPLSGYGLKEVETLTGYRRTLEESGGEWSIARYIEATETDDEDERAAIIDGILAYNREDLEATWAVMEWLRNLHRHDIAQRRLSVLRGEGLRKVQPRRRR